MSSSNTSPGASTINNFEGGRPSTKELVPAIIFTVLLALTLPLLAWRLLGRKSRTRILVNSVLFFLTRLVSLILHAYMSKRQYGPSLVIAETVLMTIGWLFLLNNLIDLWQRHVEASEWDTEAHHRDDQTLVNHKRRNVKWVKYFATFLRLLLLASLASIIAAGAILRKRLDTNEQTNLVRNLVKASYIIGLATSVISLIMTLITHFTAHRSVRKTLFLVLYTIPLIASSIYRVVETFSGYRATSRQLAAFWVVLIVMEFLAYSFLLAISIPKWFGKFSDKLHRGNSRDAEKANAVNAGHHNAAYPGDTTAQAPMGRAS